MNYGLIAGNGQFPFLVVAGARKAGVTLSVVAINEETDPKINDVAEKCDLGLDRPTWQDDLFFQDAWC